jgi:hypothetical protein
MGVKLKQIAIHFCSIYEYFNVCTMLSNKREDKGHVEGLFLI